MQLRVTMYKDLSDYPEFSEYNLQPNSFDHAVSFSVRVNRHNITILWADIEGDLVDQDQFDSLIEIFGEADIKAEAFQLTDVA